MTERGTGGEGRRFDLCPHELTNEEMMLCLPAVLQIVDKWVFELPLQQSTHTHAHTQICKQIHTLRVTVNSERWTGELMPY